MEKRKKQKGLTADQRLTLQMRHLENAYDNAVRKKHLSENEAKKLREEMVEDFKKKRG